MKNLNGDCLLKKWHSLIIISIVLSATVCTKHEEYTSADMEIDDCPFTYNILDLYFHPALSQLYTGGNCTAEENNYPETSRKHIHLICSGGLEDQWISQIRVDIRHLTISEWPYSCFPVDLIIHIFPFLTNLTIQNSTFNRFTSDFTFAARNLKHLKLHRLFNLTLPNSLLSHLTGLESLDLRENLLEYLDHRFISSPPNLTTVLLINNLWNCSHKDVKWLSWQNTTSMRVAKERIIDFKNLTCQGKMFKGKPLHVVMDLFTSLRDECPKTCHCFLTNLVQTPGWTNLVPVSTADCRWRNLKELPSRVPAITTVVLLHGNKISDVRPLAQNPTYKRVADVYLDDNQVNSLRPLEGSDWMLTFRVLSVRGNNITQLPIHAWDNAFQYNQNIGQMFLGKNPWRCDCHFTPSFQELLLKHQKIIKDLPSIKCAKSDNEDISQAQILSLSRSDICRHSDEILQPIDILNVVLSFLIILVLGKFGYDYYCFKKKGKLPWIVSKIP